MKSSPEAEGSVAGGEEEGDEHDVAEPEAEVLPPGEGRRHFDFDGVWHWHLALAIDDAVAHDDLGLHRHGQGRVEVAQLVVEEPAAYGGMTLGHGGAEVGHRVGGHDYDTLGRQRHEDGIGHEDGLRMDMRRCTVARFDDDGAGGAAGGECAEDEQDDKDAEPRDDAGDAADAVRVGTLGRRRSLWPLVIEWRRRVRMELVFFVHSGMGLFWWQYRD